MVIWGKYDKMLRWEPISDDAIEDHNVKPEDIHIIESKHYIQEESTQEILNYLISFLK